MGCVNSYCSWSSSCLLRLPLAVERAAAKLPEPNWQPCKIFPVEVQKAPVSVQQAYQFAVANPDLIQSIPCYCGCGAMGHTSNYSCYVSGENQDGSLKFDEHALGCSICVDITLDAMRLQKEGKSIPDIRQYIDDTYAPYGPSNMP